MGNSHSKQTETDETAEQAAARRKLEHTVAVAGLAFGLNVAQTSGCSPTNGDLMLKITRGDIGAAAKLVATMNTLGAVLEFSSGPAVGRVSDSVGRKPFITLGLLASSVMDLFVYRNPASKRALFLRTLISTMTNTAFVTSVRASLADQLSGRDLGVANAKVGIYAGLAVIVAPLLGSLIAKHYGPRYTFLAGGLIGLLNSALMQAYMRETLAEEKRKEVDYAALNPLSFLRLLTNGRHLAMVSLSLALQCLAEPRFIFPYLSLGWQSKYNYDAVTRGRFVSYFGVIYVLGALIAKGRIKKIGNMAHATESNVANALSLFFWAFRSDALASYLAMTVQVLGIRKRDGLESLVYAQGARLDWGKGETSGYMSNLKSASALLAPGLMGSAYAYTTSGGMDFHGSAMLAGAVATLLAEGVFQSVKGELAEKPAPEEPGAAKEK